MEAVGINQSELARRVGVTQGAIAKIANKNPNGSSKLRQIARELRTTQEYLEGETDNPDIDAPAPLPPSPQIVMMSVVLPPERALARMFEMLLAGIDSHASQAEQALLLAQRLATGLSQLRDLRPESATARVREPAGRHAIHATLDHEPL